MVTFVSQGPLRDSAARDVRVALRINTRTFPSRDELEWIPQFAAE